LRSFSASAAPICAAKSYTEPSMPSRIEVGLLEIIGYAEVLRPNMLPTVVPPVFRLKTDPGRVLVPPFVFEAGFLCNSTELAVSELNELRNSREITLFDTPFEAHEDFELWIDESFDPHYEARADATQNLRRVAEQAIGSASEALRRGDWLEAERLSSIAISASDRRVEPLAIKGAILRHEGDEAGEQLMARLASPVLEQRLFNLLVDDYYRSAPGSKAVARGHRPPVSSEARRNCDIVMKGGITSGIVYPTIVCNLADKYQFNNLGELRRERSPLR